MDEEKQQQQLDDSSLSSINDSVDDKTLDSCNGVGETDEFEKAFTCCLCLDLLYKPTVLACGHVSCFWCAHSAMSTLQESRCPTCRCPYDHFPSICRLLHFLLLKMYPAAYRRREKQILEEEKKCGVFSPQIDNGLTSLHTGDKSNPLDCEPAFSIICSQNISYPESPTKSNPSPVTEPQIYEELSHEDTAAIPEKKHAGVFECSRTSPLEDNNFCQRDMKVRGCDVVSLNDVLCGACNKLLFQPVVLNCGHVYCKSCVDPANEALKCQLCQCFHPKGVLKVCLGLDNFLEEQFSEEYMVRRAAQPEPVHLQPESPGVAEAGKKENQSSSSHNAAWWSEYGSKVNVGVGCDDCGVYPITGHRYRCKDCVETVGFDLCEQCYNTRSKRPGRFNQQHTLDHNFELAQSNLLCNIMLSLIPRQPEDENIVPQDENAVPEDENIVPQDENAVPEDENIVPQDENAVPEDENIVPQDENTVPEDENTVPEDEDPEVTPSTV